MNKKVKEEKAHASAKLKELHPHAYSQTNAAHLLLPQTHGRPNTKYIDRQEVN